MSENAETGPRNTGATAGSDELAAKIEFLRRPSSYPDHPDEVQALETHFAHVFLAGRHVYKLKKPIRYGDVDYTNVAARRASCELEVALNRRLAPSVYLGVVALTGGDGRYALDGDGPAADWLVQMRRLDRRQTLEARIRRNEVRDADLRALIDTLVRFYRRASRAPWQPAAYSRRLEHGVDENASRLSQPELGLDAGAIEAVRRVQSAFVQMQADRLQARIRDGRVIDAHGDLRPEHVFFADPPQIIDCLEFSQALRWLDAAEEIAFLALECTRLGADDVGRRLAALYVDAAGDRDAQALLGFYRSRRAMDRAMLSAWRAQDDVPRDTARQWAERARWYVGAAARSLGAGPHT